MRRALFLDRDGTLIVDAGYCCDPAQVELMPGAADALRDLPPDIARVVVTNQSGLARGLISPAQAAAVNDAFVDGFVAEGVRFDGVYVCPHHPDDDCPCRKPRPGLLIQAATELDLDLAGSIIIGDKPSDCEAGRAAGCAHVLRLVPAPADGGFVLGPGGRDDVIGWPGAARRIARLFGLE